MKYLAVLGRLPSLSLAEFEALYGIRPTFFCDSHPPIAVFDFLDNAPAPDLSHLGGTIKLARALSQPPLDFLMGLPEGKIVLGVSDYSATTSGVSAQKIAMNFKQKLKQKTGRNVRIVNTDSRRPDLPSATSHHNHLGEKPTHVELIRLMDKGKEYWFSSLGTQDITAYAARDQARPARDAKVGMLPPKLAQILINLCGPLPAGSRILDPFCGTGVVLQEAFLMGYTPYGTDLSPRMVDYAKKNLAWLSQNRRLCLGNATPLESKKIDQKTPLERHIEPSKASLNTKNATATGRADEAREKMASAEITQGDATDFVWHQLIDAVACETYLGPPMSTPPSEIKLKTVKHECREIILGFLKNLAPQLKSGTPVTIAIPAWRHGETYSSLNLLDELPELGYNVIKYNNSGKAPLLYYREGQVVAREIISLRKK